MGLASLQLFATSLDVAIVTSVTAGSLDVAIVSSFTADVNNGGTGNNLIIELSLRGTSVSGRNNDWFQNVHIL